MPKYNYPVGYLPISVFAWLVSVTTLLMCTSMTYHLSVTSPHCQQVSTKKCSRALTYLMVLNRLIDFRAVELKHDQLLTTYRRSGLGPRFLTPAVKLAISGFPHIPLTFPVTAQVRPACSVFRRLFFLVHQLVLHLYHMAATPEVGHVLVWISEGVRAF